MSANSEDEDDDDEEEEDEEDDEDFAFVGELIPIEDDTPAFELKPALEAAVEFNKSPFFSKPPLTSLL
jgi:hypothetical protein